MKESSVYFTVDKASEKRNEVKNLQNREGEKGSRILLRCSDKHGLQLIPLYFPIYALHNLDFFFISRGEKCTAPGKLFEYYFHILVATLSLCNGLIV